MTPSPTDDHLGEEALRDLTRQLNQLDEKLGIRSYTTSSPGRVKSVQLPEDDPWEGIAAWCNGMIHIEPDPPGKDFRTMDVPAPGCAIPIRAISGDWIVQGVTGSFFVRSPEEFAATYTPAPEPAGEWSHADGTPCDAGFLADRPCPEPGKLWWCTEHQQHLLPARSLAEQGAQQWQERYDDLEEQCIDLIVPLAKLLGVPAVIPDPNPGENGPEDAPKVWNLDGIHEALAKIGIGAAPGAIPDRHEASVVLRYYGAEGGYPASGFVYLLLVAMDGADVGNLSRFRAGWPGFAEAVDMAKNQRDGIERLQAIAAGQQVTR